jgi:hypothetical protein
MAIGTSDSKLFLADFIYSLQSTVSGAPFAQGQDRTVVIVASMQFTVYRLRITVVLPSPLYTVLGLLPPPPRLAAPRGPLSWRG